MIIYRAYLDSGPYDGDVVLGYFESISSSYGAIVKSCEEYGWYLGHLDRNSQRDCYPVLYSDESPSSYHYVIERVEVQP